MRKVASVVRQKPSEQKATNLVGNVLCAVIANRYDRLRLSCWGACTTALGPP